MEAPRLRDEHRQDVRLALVMSGGVSLAVWMGGAAYELYRVSRAFDEPAQAPVYRALLDLTGTRLSIDVLAGTSAGGLNGVLLATAIESGRTIEDFGIAREMWLGLGSLKSLLRRPSDHNGQSLLRGDEYFLPAIENVLKKWTRASPDGKIPLELWITTTLLEGKRLQHRDDFGEELSETDHGAHFRFSWTDTRMPGGIGWSKLVPALALAARSTASFPGAFEATFVPVGEAPAGRPDMKEFADFDTSSYVIDGGVVDNAPLGLALRAIEQTPPSGPVRRVLALLVPHPSHPEPAEPARPGRLNVPTLGRVLQKATVTIPTTQLLTADIDRLRHFEDEARALETRRRNIAELAADDDRTELALRLVRSYAAMRADRWVADVRRFATERVDKIKAHDPPRLLAHISRTLRAERRRILLRQIGAEDARLERLPVGRPWQEALEAVDPHWAEGPREGESVCDLLAAARNREGEAPVDPWPWGVHPIEYSASVGLDLLDRALAQVVIPAGEDRTAADREAAAISRDLGRLRHNLDEILSIATEFRALDHLFWQARFDSLFEVNFKSMDRTASSRLIAALVKTSFDTWPQMAEPANDVRRVEYRRCLARLRRMPVDGSSQPPLTQPEAMQILGMLAAAVAVLLIRAGPSMRRLLDPDRRDLRAGTPEEESVYLRREYGSLVDVASPNLETTLRNLMEFLIIQGSLGLEPKAAPRIELVHLSGDAQCQIDDRERADQKLAGVQLAHFGAFLKESWRANDWMWGRLDAASRIAVFLLDPQRIRKRYARFSDRRAAVAAAEADIRGAGTEAAGQRPERLDHIEKKWRSSQGAIRAELMDLLCGEPDVSTSRRVLTESAKFIAYVLQTSILEEELPRVAEAVLESFERERGAEPSLARRFRKATEKDLERTAASQAGRLLPPDAVPRLLELCLVGQERWSDESGNDLLTDTASRAAMALTNAIRNPRSGLGPLRFAANRFGGVITFFHLLAQAAIKRTRSAFAGIALALAISGSVVAIHLFAPASDLPGWLVGIGYGVLLAWAGLTALHYSRKPILAVWAVVLALLGLAHLDPAALGDWAADATRAELSVRVGAGVVAALGGLWLLNRLSKESSRRSPTASPSSRSSPSGKRWPDLATALAASAITVSAFVLALASGMSTALIEWVARIGEPDAAFRSFHENIHEIRLPLALILLPGAFVFGAVLRGLLPDRARLMRWLRARLPARLKDG